MKLELLKRMKLNYLQVISESLQYELIAIKKNAVTYSYLIQAFSSVQNDLYTGTIQSYIIIPEH
jgi:hypothetical protein